jgi:glycosyltransferase involved in cell wall biosynthesis
MSFVSICIPTFNHGRYLEASLGSAMSQTHRDLEIVVLDNASTDDTQKIVAAHASRDPRIRYVRHPKNIGLIGNLDACLGCARSEYVKFLCADDTLEPECVSLMVRAMDEHPAVALVACARIVADADLKPVRVAGPRTQEMQIDGTEMIAECFFFGNRIGEPTAVMLRRSKAARGFAQTYRQLVDMEMWIHLMQSGDLLALPMPLCRIRTHAEQATWNNDRDGRIVEDRRRLYAEFSQIAADHASLLRRLIWDFRMAYAMVRSESAGFAGIETAISEVYFPRVFPRFMHPITKFMTTMGLHRMWRTGG